MRTKALLIAAAALAATVISSEAQVYSQNIVGYVNQVLGPSYSSIATPLDISSGNSLTNVFVNSPLDSNGYGPYDLNQVYTWNGAGYTVYTIDSYWPTGVGNSVDSLAVTPPTLSPGTLYYFRSTGNNPDFKNTSFTNTVVGTVHVDGAGVSTNVVGVTTNTLTLGYNFVASKLPIAGGVSSVLGLANTPINANGYGPLDLQKILVPNINAAGNFLGFTVTTVDSYWPTGFGNSVDSLAAPEPVIPVGQGFLFLYQAQTAATSGSTGQPLKWVQSL
jgi:hypothetical protein